MPVVYPGPPRSRAATTPRGSGCPTCRAASACSTGSASRISPICAAGASRRSAAWSRRRRRPAATCRWCSRPTRSGRAGASTRPSAACRPTPACSASEPDLFVNLGDAIYADQPVGLAVPLDGGGTWRSLAERGQSQAGRDLDEFRGNYRYNLQDAHMRRFNAAGRAAHGVGRPRGARQLVSGAPPGRRCPLRRRVGGAARGAGAAGAVSSTRRCRSTAATPSACIAACATARSRCSCSTIRSYRGSNSANRQPVAGATPRRTWARPGHVARRRAGREHARRGR